MANQRERVQSLTGLALIVLIVQQLINPEQHIHVYQMFTIVSVPTIFFAIGYFLENEKSFMQDLLTYAKKYLLPYALTAVLMIVVNLLAGHLNWLKQPFPDIKTAIKTAIKTLGYGIGWPTDTIVGQSSFGVGLIWLLLAAFFALLIFKLIMKLPKRWLIVVTIMIITALGFWLRTIVQLPWSLEAAMIAQPFIYFGDIVKQRGSMPMSVAGFFVGLILWFISGISGAFDFTVAYNPHAVFGTIASLFAVNVLYIINDKVLSPLKPVQSLLAFFGNRFILNIIMTTVILAFIPLNGLYSLIIILILIGVVNFGLDKMVVSSKNGIK